ncbi:hypothetical protein DFP72DRAFT_839241 [Ephemerocybe angulata]|uniref:F-box domain-containing protein n=1 Tax=Ephemerocybe angulata TaxID=980116 RepID=A0A8H6MGB4_9AGAR|nr:hypothetical protein DFP72DRAFT_839241 [Tulosesus angulatus]
MCVADVAAQTPEITRGSSKDPANAKGPPEFHDVAAVKTHSAQVLPEARTAQFVTKFINKVNDQRLYTMNDSRFAHLCERNLDLDPIEIASIKHEIENRTLSINGPRLELQKLESERENYRTLLSPLRRNAVPPEILGQFFKSSLSISETSQEEQVNVLCLVCRRWRVTALGTPSLWASVDLTASSGRQLNFERVRTWFARSGVISKTLKIAGYHGYASAKYLQLTNLTRLTLACDWPFSSVGTILRSSVNLEVLVLDFKELTREPIEVLPSNWDPVVLPRLRKLEMRHIAGGSPDTQLLRFLRAPSLQTLEIRFGPDFLDPLSDDEVSDFTSDIISLVMGPNPVSGLQHLLIQAIPISSSADLRKVLHALPTLTHLTLVDFESDSSLFQDPFYIDNILLPNLKVLKVLDLQEDGDFAYEDIFNFLMARGDYMAEEMPNRLEEVEVSIVRCSEAQKHPRSTPHSSQLAEAGVAPFTGALSYNSNFEPRILFLSASIGLCAHLRHKSRIISGIWVQVLAYMRIERGGALYQESGTQ